MIYINARFLTQDMTEFSVSFAAELCLTTARLRDDVIFLSPRDIKQVDIASRPNVKVVGSVRGTSGNKFPFFCEKGCPLLVNLEIPLITLSEQSNHIT